MTFIPRLIQNEIEKRLFKEKVVIIYGPRQVGKTTLVKKIIYGSKEKSLYLNCELLPVRQSLGVADALKLKSYIGDHRLVVLDEAQKVTDIGTILKILVDTYPEIQIVATGSSSFDLANHLSEPLTGRARRFVLYPFSLQEISASLNRFEMESKLENILRYGLYPEVFLNDENSARERLEDISSNYLYKDILEFEGVKKPLVLTDLLQLLALQLGQEVSYNELARQLGVGRLTVQKYIDLLEKCFVIRVLRAFSRNLRKEIAKSVKIYFYDTGVRNALVQNFSPLRLRNDAGALWENFLVMERIKKSAYEYLYANRYFWRTYDGQEIDYIEEREGKLFGYEFKWGDAKARRPKLFAATYPESEFAVIDRDNYWEFAA